MGLKRGEFFLDNFRAFLDGRVKLVRDGLIDTTLLCRTNANKRDG